MAWQVHYLDWNAQRQQLLAPTVGEAVTIASKLLRDGLIVEKIQADMGTKLASRDVVAILERISSRNC
jgi:hypothetical protein